MDMFINQNNINNSNNINEFNTNENNKVPNGYQQVSKEEFLEHLSKKNDGDNNLTEALRALVQRMQDSNDRRYPVITTGRVQGIHDDGKITVQMLGDDTDVTETVGYTNQTPYAINENDYVKVCKQTAGDKVNSWIMAVNQINNKKDAMVFIQDCLTCILILQQEINDLRNSIQSLSEAYQSNTDGTITIKTNRINESLNILKNLDNVNNDVRIMQDELKKINQGKNNN